MYDLKKSSTRTRRSKKEEGSVIVEAGIALTFLIVLLTGLLDIGYLLHNYVVVSQVANEAVRYGTRLQELEEGSWDSGSATIPHGHQQIHDRVNMILAMRGRLLLQNLNITTTYRTTGETDPRANGTVLVSVDADFDGFLPGFDGLSLSSGQRGEYLQN